MKNPGTLIVACLVSAAAGVAIGMLMGPESGEKLRTGIKNITDSLLDKLSDVPGEGNASADFEESKSMNGDKNSSVG